MKKYVKITNNLPHINDYYNIMYFFPVFIVCASVLVILIKLDSDSWYNLVSCFHLATGDHFLQKSIQGLHNISCNNCAMIYSLLLYKMLWAVSYMKPVSL